MPARLCARQHVGSDHSASGRALVEPIGHQRSARTRADRWCPMGSTRALPDAEWSEPTCCRSHSLAGMARGTSSILPRPEHLSRSIPRLLAEEGTSYSFEFFPPKDDVGERTLWEAIRHLERVRPTFVSVTYGAGGSTRDRTVRLTSRIARETTLTPMAHLTCVGSTVAELRQVVGEYASTGVRNVLALRGDPPGGPGTPWTPQRDGLNHADELVALVPVSYTHLRAHETDS